jgi:putative membrane protein
MWGMHDVGWGWWLVSAVAMFVVWTAVIYGVFWLVRDAGRRPAGPERRDESAEAVLNRRLAAGEISLEEYDRVRRALCGRGPAEPKDRASVESPSPPSPSASVQRGRPEYPTGVLR